MGRRGQGIGERRRERKRGEGICRTNLKLLPTPLIHHNEMTFARISWAPNASEMLCGGAQPQTALGEPTVSPSWWDGAHCPKKPCPALGLRSAPSKTSSW